ncbi:MAG: hypothetical protein ACE149_04510 [Armatimonadota bacterium]
MRKSVIVLLALGIAVLAVAAVLYARRSGTSAASLLGKPAGVGAQQSAGSGAGGQQRTLAYFGITGGPSQTEPRGLLISSLAEEPNPSPLKLIGVQVGDVIVSCNGGTKQMGERLYSALDGLQNRGEKITLVVVRDGKQMTLERTDKLPAAAVPPDLGR